MAEIEIVDYAPVRPANPFDEHVAALIAAGEGKAIAIHCTDEEYKSVKRKIRDAATFAGYTSRFSDETFGPDDKGNDEWTLTVRVKKLPTPEEKAERAAKRAEAEKKREEKRAAKK